MTGMEMLVGVVSIAACLVLAVRACARAMSFERTAMMGLIWAAGIAALAIFLQRYQ